MILILPDFYTQPQFKFINGIKLQIWILYLYDGHKHPQILLHIFNV